MFLINKSNAVAASLVLSAVVGLNSSVMAEETPANAGVTATTVEEAAPGLTDRLAVRSEFIYDGASITEPLSSYRPHEDGDTQAKQGMRNMVYGGYKLDDTKQVGVAIPFGVALTRGGSFAASDPNVRLINLKMVSAGNFSLFSDLRLYVPGVSADARKFGMYTAVRTTQAASYAIPSTRITLGTTGIAKTSFYGNDNGGKDLEFYVGPNVSYQFTPTLSAGVLYEFEAKHTFHDSMKNFGFGHNVEPNLSWDMTPSVNLNPWLDIDPTKLSLKYTTIGGQVTVSVL